MNLHRRPSSRTGPSTLPRLQPLHFRFHETKLLHLSYCDSLQDVTIVVTTWGQNRDSGGFPVRIVAPIAALLVLAVTIIPAHASSSDALPPDQESIDALEAKAVQAQPREQCFLYAEIVHQMTELSIRQYASGDVGKATGLLKQIQQFAQKIHFSIGDNDKRLKNSEMLLSHTVF